MGLAPGTTPASGKIGERPDIAHTLARAHRACHELAGLVHKLVERRRGEPHCGVLFHVERSCPAGRRGAAICLFFMRPIALMGDISASSLPPISARVGRFLYPILLGWHAASFSAFRVAIVLAITGLGLMDE